MADNVLKDLVSGSQKGNHTDFQALFDRLHGRLFAYARSHTGEREEAMDVVQETMIGLWEALPNFEYRTDAAFLAFVFLILKRRLMKTYNATPKKAFSLEQMLEDVGDKAMPSETPEYEDHRTLMKVLGELSEGAREVIELRYWGELSFKEIAATMEINESAAKVRHHRAMSELRDTLQHYGIR